MNNNSSQNITYYQNQPVSLQTNQMQQSSPSNYIMATNQQQPQQQQYYQQPNNTFIQQQNGINVQKQSVNLQNGQMMPNNYQINANSYQTSNQIPIQVQQSVPWGNQNTQYQQYIQPQQQTTQQQLSQNITSQQPKPVIKMNQFILAKPATTTPPPPSTTTVTSQSTNQTVVSNQGQFNQMIKSHPYSQQQQQIPQQQVNYTQNSINYVNNNQNIPNQLNIMSSPIQPTQQHQQYVQPQMNQQLNGTKPQQMQQTNPSFVINSNNNQQTNANNQSAQYYTQQQQQKPGVVIAQIQQQQQPQQVYSTFITQPNVVQTNGISYSSPLQSNRIVYINNNNTITSNSTIPMNTYQTNGNNICIVQKPLNQQMPNQQIIFAQTPIQPNNNSNNQTPNKIQLNQSNGVVNQVSFHFNF